jgi:hypothetical protein
MTSSTPPESTGIPVSDAEAPLPSAAAPSPGPNTLGVPNSGPPGGDAPAATGISPAETRPRPASLPVSPAKDSNRGELIGLLHKLLEQEEKRDQNGKPAKLIGPDNLVVEGLLKVVSDDGIVVSVPVNTFLPGALAPAAAHVAQQQFGMVLDQLVTQPALTAFLAHLERVHAKRKAGTGPVSQLEAAPPEKENAAQSVEESDS